MKTATLAGAAGALAARALFRRALLAKFRHDVTRLNAGDYGPLLSSYADDAVLHFNEGDHRWAGIHRGRPAIERFLREFTAAGVQGEIKDLWIAGPPWALRMVARFDDWAAGPDGRRVYANRTALVLRTRWARIVEHEDFYEDTGRIEAFESQLRSVGREPQTAPALVAQP
ncbi:MAG TPA: nuclear transport factor 2 family protein [Solirubrobacteraceae bacterium]|nr:nuclear transport factor 2 family protein [Solirubrobacteraceae bacterium]